MCVGGVTDTRNDAVSIFFDAVWIAFLVGAYLVYARPAQMRWMKNARAVVWIPTVGCVCRLAASSGIHEVCPYGMVFGAVYSVLVVSFGVWNKIANLSFAQRVGFVSI